MPNLEFSVACPNDLESLDKIITPKNTGVAILGFLDAYMNESWYGNLMDIMNASINNYARRKKVYISNKALGRSGFFEKVPSCCYNCRQCGYCSDIARRLVNSTADVLTTAGASSIVFGR